MTAVDLGVAHRGQLNGEYVDRPSGLRRARPTVGVRLRTAIAEAVVVVGRALTAARRFAGLVLRLMPGVALAITGLGITGGSFGLLAFIGMPLLIAGLGLITACVPTVPAT